MAGPVRRHGFQVWTTTLPVLLLRSVEVTSKARRMSPPLEKSIDLPPHYAQVAFPVHLSKTFTYRRPPSIQQVARVGSRVVAQLGAKPLTGYIVALLPRLRSGTSLVESELKEVQELLDVDPPLTTEVLEITRWVADYYAAPWGEVMRAALPAGINATVEQMVSITAEGRAALSDLEISSPARVRTNALRLLATEGEFELNAFCLRIGATKAPQWLRELETEGLIERSYRTRSTVTRAKRRRAVRLVNSEGNAHNKRATSAQQRAIEVLRAHQNAMAVSDLIRAANVSESVVRTLAKRGVVE